MKRVQVAPGLLLDEQMYAVTVEALKSCAPDQAAGLTWERFIDRTSWCLVPDVNRPDVPFYKAELDVYQHPDRLRKLRVNVWAAPDLRRDGAPMPHSHPWPFESHVLLGGYTEDRYERIAPDEAPTTTQTTGTAAAAGSAGVESVEAVASVEADGAGVEVETRRHAAGEANRVALYTFHEVTEILVPGRTVTLMDCGQSTSGRWGYLDPDTGAFFPNIHDPVFMELLRDRNPHLR